MIYPENIESKIGFDKIRQILIGYCLGPLGVVHLEKIGFGSELETINRALDQTAELAEMISQKLPYPKSGYLDCSESMDRIPIEGIFLSEEEFYDLKVATNTINEWSAFLKKNRESFPRLADLGKLIALDNLLWKSIDRVIDDKGLVRNGASPQLSRIRQQVLSKKRKARSAVERFLNQCIKSNYSKSDAVVSIRNGRPVIPVIAQHKRSIQGFIHDESSSGQTSYIEPAEALSMNNEVTDLEYQEKREVVRILTQLTDEFRPHLSELETGFHFLGQIDCIQAKARLAQRLKATRPEIIGEQIMRWKTARHPLLFLAYQKQKKRVVPLNMSLATDQRILINAASWYPWGKVPPWVYSRTYLST